MAKKLKDRVSDVIRQYSPAPVPESQIPILIEREDSYDLGELKNILRELRREKVITLHMMGDNKRTRWYSYNTNPKPL